MAKEVGKIKESIPDIKSVEEVIGLNIEGNLTEFPLAVGQQMMHDWRNIMSDRQLMINYSEEIWGKGAKAEDYVDLEEDFDENGNYRDAFYFMDSYYITFNDGSEIYADFNADGDSTDIGIRNMDEAKGKLAEKWLPEFEMKGWNMDIDSLMKEVNKNKKRGGGEVSKNHYEGKTPKGVWYSWTTEQRWHFLHDHKDELDEHTDDFIAWVNKYMEVNDFDKLPKGMRKVISEHVEQGSYKKGGKLWDNHYEGKYDEQIWREWTVEQRAHFLSDHADKWGAVDWKWEQFEQDDSPTFHRIAKRYGYEDLPGAVRYALREHIVEGSYAKGGKITKVDITPNYYRFRIRSPKDVATCAVPAWATKVAESVNKGSKITTCKKDGKWFVQSIMIDKNKTSESKARKDAHKILDKFEKRKEEGGLTEMADGGKVAYRITFTDPKEFDAIMNQIDQLSSKTKYGIDSEEIEGERLRITTLGLDDFKMIKEALKGYKIMAEGGETGKKQLKKGDTIQILGRRWFDKVNGNTYHSVDVYVNNELVGRTPFKYGYERAYEQTGREILLKHYNYPKNFDKYKGLEAHGIKVLYNVTDVSRKKDLEEGGETETYKPSFDQYYASNGAVIYGGYFPEYGFGGFLFGTALGAAAGYYYRDKVGKVGKKKEEQHWQTAPRHTEWSKMQEGGETKDKVYLKEES